MALRIKTNTLEEFTELQTFILSLGVKWAEGQDYLLYLDNTTSYYVDSGLTIREPDGRYNRLRIIKRDSHTDYDMEWEKANKKVRRSIQRFVQSNGKSVERIPDPMRRVKAWKEETRPF